MTAAFADHRTEGDVDDDHPFIGRVQRYADTVLAPSALHTDRHGVPADRVADLSDLGLLNHLAPSAFGGAAIGRATDRRIHEILSEACLNTWLVWTQHAPVVARVAKAAASDRITGPLVMEILSGRLLLGAALSDVRGYPDRHVSARPTSGGWILSGTVSWVSGWGLSSALLVSGVHAQTERVVTAIVPVSGRMTASPLDLHAAHGSRTERVRIDDVFVPDDSVLDVEPLADWNVVDRASASDARAHHFGVAAAILRELSDESNPRAVDVAAVWRPRLTRLRAAAYRLSDEAASRGDIAYHVAERLATRVAVGEALATISRALVITRAGRGLAADDTAQLHARNALFVLVQGQRSDIRDAQLAQLAR